MERVMKHRILEDPQRLLNNDEVTVDIIDYYLRKPRVREIYKMALDIKSSECTMRIDAFSVRCSFPISDDVSIYLNVLDKRGIYLTLRKNKYIIPHSVEKLFYSNDIQRELLLALKDLEGDFGKELNFKILKEYLESEYYGKDIKK